MNKVNARNKWSLSIGCVGRDLCYTLVSLFLLTYLQFTGLFDTTQFLVLSVIIVLCRVWDAINDPMMGTIITNTKSRFGKYRPWVIIGALLNSIFLVLMFICLLLFIFLYCKSNTFFLRKTINTIKRIYCAISYIYKKEQQHKPSLFTTYASIYEITPNPRIP